jgi:hypothetical protein
MQPFDLSAESFLQHFLGYLAFGIDVAVGVVIAISVIRGFVESQYKNL